MSLAIVAASASPIHRNDTAVPGRASYPHLNSIAGVSSSLPSAALLRSAGYERPARKPRGKVHLGSEVESHARALLDEIGSDASPICDVIHCQATLSEQILESVALRVAYAVARTPRRVMAVDQTGTTGVATALALGLQAPIAGKTELMLITAADAWCDAFPGSFLPLVEYSDAVGALVLRQADPAGDAERDRAHLLGVVCKPGIASAPFWNSTPEEVRGTLVARLLEAAEEVMANASWDATGLDLLLGDAIGPGLAHEVASRLGATPDAVLEPSPTHFGSAALVANIITAIQCSESLGRALNCLIWTASAGGDAAAIALRAMPRIARRNLR